MFSGKTQELIRQLSVLKYTRKKIITFKYYLDDRYENDSIVSHYGYSYKAININKPNEIYDYDVEKYDIIAFDEAQFFDESITEIIDELLNKNKMVLVAGLDLDYLGRPFGQIPFLMAKADNIIKLKAICITCGNPATRTFRLDTSHNKSTDKIIVIGSKDKYEARCKFHLK